MYNNVKMGVWVANKLGALNPTFIKYRNTLESYETFSRIVEARAFLKQIRQKFAPKHWCTQTHHI